MAEARKRVQIDFSNSAMKRLQSLAKRSEASSNAEVVRNALRLYDWFLTKQENDFQIYLKKADGEAEKIELLW